MTDETRREDGSSPRFEEELRRWAARPPASGTSTAAARLRARLQHERTKRRGGRWPSLASAAAAGLALVAVALRFGGLSDPSIDDPAGPGSATISATAWEPSPVGRDVVVMPLEDGTILYMSLGVATVAAAGANAL